MNWFLNKFLLESQSTVPNYPLGVPIIPDSFLYPDITKNYFFHHALPPLRLPSYATDVAMISPRYSFGDKSQKPLPKIKYSTEIDDIDNSYYDRLIPPKIIEHNELIDSETFIRYTQPAYVHKNEDDGIEDTNLKLLFKKSKSVSVLGMNSFGNPWYQGMQPGMMPQGYPMAPYLPNNAKTKKNQQYSYQQYPYYSHPQGYAQNGYGANPYQNASYNPYHAGMAPPLPAQMISPRFLYGDTSQKALPKIKYDMSLFGHYNNSYFDQLKPPKIIDPYTNPVDAETFKKYTHPAVKNSKNVNTIKSKNGVTAASNEIYQDNYYAFVKDTISPINSENITRESNDSLTDDMGGFPKQVKVPNNGTHSEQQIQLNRNLINLNRQQIENYNKNLNEFTFNSKLSKLTDPMDESSVLSFNSENTKKIETKNNNNFKPVKTSKFLNNVNAQSMYFNNEKNNKIGKVSDEFLKSNDWLDANKKGGSRESLNKKQERMNKKNEYANMVKARNKVLIKTNSNDSNSKNGSIQNSNTNSKNNSILNENGNGNDKLNNENPPHNAPKLRSNLLSKDDYLGTTELKNLTSTKNTIELPAI